MSFFNRFFLEIRKFQHKAGLKLAIHKEILYEFFRFIRNTVNHFKKLKDCVDKYLLCDDVDKKINSSLPNNTFEISYQPFFYKIY
jgi:hypothetical protein